MVRCIVLNNVHIEKGVQKKLCHECEFIPFIVEYFVSVHLCFLDLHRQTVKNAENGFAAFITLRSKIAANIIKGGSSSLLLPILPKLPGPFE